MAQGGRGRSGGTTAARVAGGARTEFGAWPMEGSSGRPGSTGRALALLRSRSEGQGGPRVKDGEQIGRRPLTCSSAPGRFGRERGRDRDGLAPVMVLDSDEAFATACGDRGAVVWRNSGGAAARHGGTGRAGAARVLARRRRWDEEAQGLQGQLKESRASWASVPG